MTLLKISRHDTFYSCDCFDCACVRVWVWFLKVYHVNMKQKCKFSVECITISLSFLIIQSGIRWKIITMMTQKRERGRNTQQKRKEIMHNDVAETIEKESTSTRIVDRRGRAWTIHLLKVMSIDRTRRIEFFTCNTYAHMHMEHRRQTISLSHLLCIQIHIACTSNHYSVFLSLFLSGYFLFFFCLYVSLFAYVINNFFPIIGDEQKIIGLHWLKRTELNSIQTDQNYLFKNVNLTAKATQQQQKY